MGSRTQLELLLAFLTTTGIHPLVDSVHSLADVQSAAGRLWRGEAFGKIVIRVPE